MLALMMLSPLVFSAPMKNVTGTINKVQIMGKNYQTYSTQGEAIVFIHMNALPPSCANTNGYRRIAITSDHPAFNSVLSAALAAKASGDSVQIFYLEECTLWNQNAWDFVMINLI